MPGVENSHITYARILPQVVPVGARWLELGCGHSLVPDWLSEPPLHLEGRAIGLDADFTALHAHQGLRHKVGGDVHSLPFRGGAFDVITANMVVEHLHEPLRLFREIHRVLAPGGRLLIHTPNRLGYTTRLARAVPERLKGALARHIQHRRTEDVYPAVYRANTEQALAALAEAVGLQLQRCDHVLTSPQLHLVPLLVCLELLWLRRLARPQHAQKRPVLIAVFVKPA